MNLFRLLTDGDERLEGGRPPVRIHAGAVPELPAAAGRLLHVGTAQEGTQSCCQGDRCLAQGQEEHRHCAPVAHDGQRHRRQTRHLPRRAGPPSLYH